MASYKNYYTEDYKRNEADWPSLVKRPLLDPEGRWKYGAPMALESEVKWAVVLAMSEAPGDLVQACIRRAQEVLRAIDGVDLFNTDARHARSTQSKISYLRSKVLLGLLEGNLSALETWRELAVLKLQLFEELEKAPDEKLHAALYYLLAHEYTEANKVLGGMRGARGYELEYNALKKLTAEMDQNEGGVKSAEVRDQVLDYFEQMREPGTIKKFDKNYLDKFEWALFIAEAVDPGDGRLDAKRALDMVSR